MLGELGCGRPDYALTWGLATPAPRSASPPSTRRCPTEEQLGTDDLLGPFLGVVDELVGPEPALHTSCVNVRGAGARLLTRAQAPGVDRTDVDGADLFALASSLAWLGDQPGLGASAEHLFDVLVGAILTDRAA